MYTSTFGASPVPDARSSPFVLQHALYVFFFRRFFRFPLPLLPCGLWVLRSIVCVVPSVILQAPPSSSVSSPGESPSIFIMRLLGFRCLCSCCAVLTLRFFRLPCSCIPVRARFLVRVGSCISPASSSSDDESASQSRFHSWLVHEYSCTCHPHPIPDRVCCVVPRSPIPRVVV